MGKNKANVKINGTNYSISGTQNEQYLKRVGTLVKNRVRDILDANPSLSNTDAAVFAAFSIADELISIQDEHTLLDERINKLINEPELEKPEKYDGVFVHSRTQ